MHLWRRANGKEQHTAMVYSNLTVQITIETWFNSVQLVQDRKLGFDVRVILVSISKLK